MNDNSRSTTARCSAGSSPSLLAARQKSASRFCASARPPRARPSASITAFMAPAEVPEMPSIASRSSLKQMVEHAPGEGAMRAAALQGEIDALGLLRRLAACRRGAGQRERRSFFGMRRSFRGAAPRVRRNP